MARRKIISVTKKRKATGSESPNQKKNTVELAKDINKRNNTQKEGLITSKTSDEEEEEEPQSSDNSERILNLGEDLDVGNDSDYIAGDSLEDSQIEEIDDDEVSDISENERNLGEKKEEQEEKDREPPNTVGNIPMEWYDDYPHIGYDMDGKKIMKPAKGDELDKFLDKMEDPDYWLSVKDDLTQQNVKLTDEELDIIRRIQMQEIPDANYNPYEPMVEWFTSKPEVMPLSAAPEPKRRFVPSKWEAKRIMKIVRAIREGRIIPGNTQVQKPRFYNLWADSDQSRQDHPMHIPAPKMKLPDHDESYNPPAEYLPNEKEKEEWEQMDPEDREKNYLPQKYSSLRAVPAYGRFIHERFNRCLDLYLAPRLRRNKLNIDPESLIPKLPNPKDLQPFPTRLAFSYIGHTGRIRCFSIDPLGLWLVSGSDDQTIRVWEITTGRCVYTWTVDDIVHSIAWCPNKDVCGFIVAFSNKVAFISPFKLCDEEMYLFTNQYVTAGFNQSQKDDKKKNVHWVQPTEQEKESGYLVILNHSHSKTVKQVTWHRKGDYFATLAPDAGNQGILIHQLTKHQTQQPFRKIKGIVQRVMFHPIKPLFFVATQRFIRVYNLIKQEAMKTLQSGVKWISSLDVHPMGDNIIIGSYDKRLCWFDLDLSSRPYKILRYHSMAIRSVSYHKRFPLFASCSDDGSIQIFHGMVYNDLLQNPLIVPVKILKGGHNIVDSLGVLHCEFHPTQPWIISSGADHQINLWT
ncbi:14022_t:CDS:10 [Ambispora leptoticha]|uniref:Ribosome biogenesis protein ERB1 n=1 Tax=Ambispora leptoticha TaxID=144679 RepID=A0A9N8V8I8_9GLOM|nr:14022_t:CDS:10 [Ambispora leptoticha]